MRRSWLPAVLLAVAAPPPGAAFGQAIDMSQGGSVTVTAAGGIDWDQKAQTVTAYGQARAVRGAVTVDADRLTAFYRRKHAAGGAPAASPTPAVPATPVAATTAAGIAGGNGAPDDSGSNEIYRLLGVGHVHIYTATDQAWGDRAVYDIDQGVLILTGHDLRLATPNDTVTARDSLEYWPGRRMSVARGDASITTTDGRRIQADILVGYSVPAAPAGGAVRKVASTAPAGDPVASSGKLQRAEAYGDVVVRTATETVRGDRGLYLPETGIARILGHVRITRGQNELDGEAAIVDMKSGLATLTQDPGVRVQGLIVPNDHSVPGASAGPAAGTAKPSRKPARPGGSP